MTALFLFETQRASDASPRRPNTVLARGTYEIRDEADLGFLAVVGRGAWTIDEVDQQFVELERLAASIRASGEPLRVLVDLRQSTMQNPQVARRISLLTERLYRAEDRVAFVVASSLLKVHMRRLPMAAEREIFLSESAAKTWLLAYA